MTMHFRIRTAIAATPEVVHRLRNLGEDLYRELGDLAHIDMQLVDAATEEFMIEVPSSRDLGQVKKLLEKRIARSAPDGAFTFERL